MSESKLIQIADWHVRLRNAGFSEWEAENIIAALRCNDGEDVLFDKAEQWVTWCIDTKRQFDCIVRPATTGILRVDYAESGELTLAIEDGESRLSSAYDFYPREPQVFGEPA